MVEQANELILDILPLSADTARLVRVYGTVPCVTLPGSVPAPAGGSLALTELGDYCFPKAPQPACAGCPVPLRSKRRRHGAADPGVWTGGGAKARPPVRF